MKLSIPAGVALCLLGITLFTTTSFLLVPCQKEESFNKTIPETDNTRESGAVAVNPALLSAANNRSNNNFPFIKTKQRFINHFVCRGETTKKWRYYSPPVNKTSPFNNSTVSGTINIPTATDHVGISLVSSCTLKV